jgi:hypothetical protein
MKPRLFHNVGSERHPVLVSTSSMPPRSETERKVRDERRRRKLERRPIVNQDYMLHPDILLPMPDPRESSVESGEAHG